LIKIAVNPVIIKPCFIGLKIYKKRKKKSRILNIITLILFLGDTGWKDKVIVTRILPKIKKLKKLINANQL